MEPRDLDFKPEITGQSDPEEAVIRRNDVPKSNISPWRRENNLVHEYDYVDVNKMEKDSYQHTSPDKKSYRPNIPLRPNTNFKTPDIPHRDSSQRNTVPVPLYKGSETINRASDMPSQIGRQILIRAVPDRMSTRDITQRLEEDILDFENAFEDLRVNRCNGEAIRTLQNIEAVDDLLTRARSGETFTFGDTEVEILPYNQPPIDKTKVFLSGLNHNTAADDIFAFVKSILVDCSYSVVIGESPGTALLCLENPADIFILKIGMQHYCIGADRTWCLSDVERTRKLRVKVTAGETNAESLEAYFKEKALSGGGATESIIHRHNFEDYIVTFENYEDAEHVLQRTNHTLNDTKLDVSIYPPCLDPNEEFLTRIPGPIQLHNCDPYISRFLHYSPRHNRDLENSIKIHFGRVIWPPEETKDCLQILCDVQENDRVAKSKITDWKESSAAAVVEKCKTLRVHYANCAVELLGGLRAQIRKMEVSDAETVSVFYEENQVVIAGEEKSVEDMAKRVESVIQEMEHTLNSSGKNITKILKVKSHEIDLIKATSCLEQLRNVKIELEKEKRRVRFNGKKELVDTAFAKVNEIVKGLPKQDIEGISLLEWTLLQTEKTRKLFKQKLEEAKVTGVLALTADSTLALYSVTQKELKKAANILKELVKNTTIKVKSNIGKGGKEFLAKLELEYNDDLATKLCKNTLRFVSLDTVHEEIKDRIQHYVDSREDTKEIMQIDLGTFRYLFVYKQHDIYDIVQRHKSQNVEIDVIDKPYRKGFMISGEKEKCKLAIVELNETIGSVIRSDHIVSFDRFAKCLQTMEGKEVIKTIEFAEKCVLTLTTPLSLVPPSEQRSSVVASCKIGQAEIKVVEGDILDTEANFIVCPTFSTFEFKRGLGGALVEKGGFSIQKYCNDHIERVKSLKDGDIFVGMLDRLLIKELFT